MNDFQPGQRYRSEAEPELRLGRVHDIQATIFHCMGIDHQRLAINVGGSDVRLTGVEKHAPVSGILA